METAGSGARGAQRFVVTAAEREVADLLPIEVAPELARATVRGVPIWFHTFAESGRGHLHAGRHARSPLPRGDAARRVCRDAGARRRYVRWLLRVPRRAPRGRAGTCYSPAATTSAFAE